LTLEIDEMGRATIQLGSPVETSSTKMFAITVPKKTTHLHLPSCYSYKLSAVFKFSIHVPPEHMKVNLIIEGVSD